MFQTFQCLEILECTVKPWTTETSNDWLVTTRLWLTSFCFKKECWDLINHKRRIDNGQASLEKQHSLSFFVTSQWLKIQWATITSDKPLKFFKNMFFANQHLSTKSPLEHPKNSQKHPQPCPLVAWVCTWVFSSSCLENTFKVSHQPYTWEGGGLKSRTVLSPLAS